MSRNSPELWSQFKNRLFKRLRVFLGSSNTIGFYLLTSMVVLSINTYASNDSNCLPLIDQEPNQMHELVSTNFMKATTESTVEVQGSISGQHGGKIFTVVKSGKSWLSAFSTNRYDIQGDPRWFIAAHGEEFASFFGFNIINSSKVTIPDAVEFQGALDKLNKKLELKGYDPVSLRFEHVDIQKPVTDYLNSLARNTMPIAQEGNHFVHDMSLHSGALFIPNHFLEMANKQAQFIIKFMDYLETIENPIAAELSSLSSYAKFFLIRNFDNGTGFENIVRIAEESKNLETVQGMLLILNRMTDSQLSNAELVSPSSLLGLEYNQQDHPSGEVFLQYAPVMLEKYTVLSYAKHLLKQLLESKETISHGKKTFTMPMSELIHTNPRDLSQDLDYLDSLLIQFSQTQEGRDGDLNVYTALAPTLVDHHKSFDSDGNIIKDSPLHKDLARQIQTRRQQIEEAFSSL